MGAVNRAIGGRSILAVLALVAVAYVLLRARYVQGGDNGEFLVVGEEGGVPHPPGYPLYVLWLRAWTWLPFDAAAERAAVATSMTGVACVALLYLAAIRWGVSRPLAAVACAVFAFTPRAWTLFTEAEVFGPNAMMAAALLAVSAPRALPKSFRTVALLGVSAGLALSNHHSAVLLAPIGLVAAATAVPAVPQGRVRALLAGVGAFLLGLAPYIYLWMVGRAPHGRWVWGDTGTLRGLLDHVLRREYGTFRLGPEIRSSDPFGHVAALMSTAAEDFLWIPWGFAVWGFFLVVRRALTGERVDRAHHAGLALTALLTGPLFASRFNIDPAGLGVFFVQRFYLLFYVLVALLFGIGLEHLVGSLARRMPRSFAALPIVTAALAALAAFPEVRASRHPGIEAYLEDTLRPLPERAVVFGDSDLRGFGTLYLQRVRRYRPDVAFVVPVMLERAWYRERVRAEHGLVLPSGGDRLALAQAVHAAKRPLFTMDPTALWEGALVAFENYPFGTTIRLLPAGAARPTTAEVEEINRRLLADFRVAPELRAHEDGWERLILSDYARPWQFLQAEFAEQGNGGGVERCRAELRRLQPL